MISSTTLAAAAKVAEHAARISTPSPDAGEASLPQPDAHALAMNREARGLASNSATFASHGAPAPNGFGPRCLTSPAEREAAGRTRA